MIYIYTFGSKVLKVANSTPLEVGAENRDNFLYDLKYNSGDNMSDQNEYFGELTGMYWVWKNCKQYSWEKDCLVFIFKRTKRKFSQ